MEGTATKTSKLYGDHNKNELFFHKIISRTSSVGCSSRANYYYRDGKGVPFDWEMRPGTPKEPPRAATPLPPLSPPPAILSLALPKPSILEDGDRNPRKELASRIIIRLDALKKIIKKYKLSKTKKEVHVEKDQHEVGDNNVDKFEDSFEFWSLDPKDEDFRVSMQRSSSSGSSTPTSTLSFSNGTGEESTNEINSWRDRPRGCIPFKLNNIMVYVAKRS